MISDKQVEAAWRAYWDCDEKDGHAKIRAALEAAEAAAWEPIESAPKGGTRVMLWSPEWETPQSGAMYGKVWAYCSKAVLHGGWKYQPTRWRPFPQPPKETT